MVAAFVHKHHASVSGSSQVLYVGTTHGMIAWNTSDSQGGAPSLLDF